MDNKEFRIYHSKLIEQYQFIEWHLEGIFGLLENGDFEELTHRVENDAMGELIRKVRFLVKEYKYNDIITKNDFESLDKIRDDRNYYCHENYLTRRKQKGIYSRKTNIYNSGNYGKLDGGSMMNSSCLKLLKNDSHTELS